MNTIYFLNAYHLGCSWPPWPLGPRGPGPTRYGRMSELQTTPFWFYVAIFIEMMVWPKINAANVVSTPTAKGAKEAAPVAVDTNSSPLCLTSHHLKWIGIRVEFWPDPFSKRRKRVFCGRVQERMPQIFWIFVHLLLSFVFHWLTHMSESWRYILSKYFGEVIKIYWWKFGFWSNHHPLFSWNPILPILYYSFGFG